MIMSNTSTHLFAVGREILLPSVSFKFIAMIIGAIGNIAVLIYTIFLKKDKTVTSYLVGNLALADLLVCLTFYPIWITEFVRTILDIDSDQDLFCKLSRSTIWSFFFASIATLLAITVDRYIYIVRPLKYPIIVTNRRVLVAVSGIWLISCGFLTVLQIYSRKFDSPRRGLCRVVHKNFFSFLVVFVGFLPLVIVFVLNFRILSVGCKQRKRILSEETITVGNEQSSQNLIAIRRFFSALKEAKTFSVVIVVLAFCVLTPTLIGLALTNFCTESCRHTWYVVLHYELYGINSIVNPFIYGMRHMKYRKAFKDILLGIFRRHRGLRVASEHS